MLLGALPEQRQDCRASPVRGTWELCSGAEGGELDGQAGPANSSVSQTPEYFSVADG